MLSFTFFFFGARYVFKGFHVAAAVGLVTKQISFRLFFFFLNAGTGSYISFHSSSGETFACLAVLMDSVAALLYSVGDSVGRSFAHEISIVSLLVTMWPFVLQK